MEITLLLGLACIGIITYRITKAESIKRERELESYKKWKERTRSGRTEG